MFKDSKKYHVVIEFAEDLLGTVPKDKEIYTSFVASKAPELELAEEEIETVPESDERGYTGFHTSEDGRIFLLDYVIKGFFKEVCGALRRVKGSKSAGIKAYKKEVDKLVFVDPRQIYIDLKGKELTQLERPLRASTPQGDRVALTKSDCAPAGSTIEFEVTVMGGAITPDVIQEWFWYGQFSGLGQWRNASYGRFNCVSLEEIPALSPIKTGNFTKQS